MKRKFLKLLCLFAVITGDLSYAEAEGFSLPSSSFCSEWSGFLNPVFNIAEHSNLGSEILRIRSTLYNSSGGIESEVKFELPPNGQFDLLVHDLQGWKQDSHGLFCSRVVSGSSSSLDVRMIHYKSSTKPEKIAGQLFDYVVYLSAGSGLKGDQLLSINTFWPKRSAFDPDYLSANWVHVRNLENTNQGGQLRFIDHNGSEIITIPLELAPGERIDFAAHEIFGSSSYGSAQWHPDSNQSSFYFRNMRYF
jgi:hypothetical protein